MDKRHIAFIDILGIRRALAEGRLSAASEKVEQLVSIIKDVIPRYEGIVAHGATDFFLLWSKDQDIGWRVALASVEVFQRYFDLNLGVKDIMQSFLLRGGVAYGELDELRHSRKPVTYSITLGTGLARAYEAQASQRGMRLILSPGASSAFRPLPSPDEAPVRNIKIDRHHSPSGQLTFSEIRWVGIGEEVDVRVKMASRLFRRALAEYRRGKVTEDVVVHFQQTLCVTLNGCSSIDTLFRFLNYRHSQKSARPFLGPICATAWLRLFRPKNAHALQERNTELWEKFLVMSGSPMITDVSQALSLYNRWRPLIRYFKKGELRFGPRVRSRKSI